MESIERNKYTFYASKAREQGFENIAAVFMETADNELEHARRFLEAINGDGSGIHLQMTVPAFQVGSTLENLKDSVNAENEEQGQSYPHYAAIAEQEGFTEIAELFRIAASIEREHQARFVILSQQLEAGNLYKRQRSVPWKCRNCGYVVDANEAPAKCPSCGRPQTWFEMKAPIE